MRDYSPKRRTALVFTGSGSTGAYHAGVLRALDESGVKIDLVVGSGIGAVTAAYAAVGGGPRLYGRRDFWDGVRWRTFYRLRPAVRIALTLLGVSFVIFALPVLLGLVLGILFPLLLIAERAKGTPRIINILCDNSLLNGYALDQKNVDDKSVKEAAKDLNLKSFPGLWTWIVISLCIVGVVLIVLLLQKNGLLVPLYKGILKSLQNIGNAAINVFQYVLSFFK